MMMSDKKELFCFIFNLIIGIWSPFFVGYILKRNDFMGGDWYAFPLFVTATITVIIAEIFSVSALANLIWGKK